MEKSMLRKIQIFLFAAEIVLCVVGIIKIIKNRRV